MSGYDAVILATLAGFILLAYVLLAPVYRFLKREERLSKDWTPEKLAARSRETKPSGDGAPREGDPTVQDLG
ncbi:MAG TPA: hypothetical protein VF190_06825 [Rhodothermales bacterium]